MERGHVFKVVLLGEGAVGKTSLVLRYMEDKFNDKHIETKQAAYSEKKLNIAGKRVQLNIWDTAGQEKYHALGPIYYRDSNGALVVYDITDEDSFSRAQNWVKELHSTLGPNFELCIIGNKVDREKDRNVKRTDAVQYAASVGGKHYEASAKLNQGVDELFLDIAKRMVVRAESATSHSSSEQNNRQNSRRSIAVVDDEQVSSERKGCCSSS